MAIITISEPVGGEKDCFGFHSEYCVHPEWRRWGCGKAITRGYSPYSEHEGNIYFVRFVYEDCYIIKSDVKKKTSCAIKLDTDKKWGYRNYNCFDSGVYLAVNRQGYFVYGNRMITLFGFDGHEIYTHPFGQKDYAECVYIYDDKVYYSETKKTGLVSQIHCVNMVTREERRVWGTQKGDPEFDQTLRDGYKAQWGMELPFFRKPSDVGNVSCAFLYANQHRVVAGYVRNKVGRYISYIIQADLATGESSVIECCVVDYHDDGLPSKDSGRIFSFDMLYDSMWVATGGESDGQMFTAGIQRMAGLPQKSVKTWRLVRPYGCCAFYYRDRERFFYVPDYGCEVSRISEDGNETGMHDGSGAYKKDFWFFGDILIIPPFWSVRILTFMIVMGRSVLIAKHIVYTN